MAVTAPESLRHPDLDPVWAAISLKLARNGLDWRGRVQVPVVQGSADLALVSLLGTRRSRLVDLGVLEAALARVGAGDDLPAALDALGVPVATDRFERRATREAAAVARDEFRSTAADWPRPWAESWADDVIRAGLLAGLDADAATQMVAATRAVIDHVALSRVTGVVRSRTEVAARVLGDAHALDPGMRLRAVLERALIAEHGEGDRLWERAGLAPDATSAPVLVWGLAGLHPLLEAANDAGVPAHLTAMALRRRPVTVLPGSSVLVVENPRLVEAAAERDHPRPMICANGQPSTAVRLLVDQLVAGGAEVRYHGDFDAPGLAMCARMAGLGVIPWHMDAEDYVSAVADARARNVALPLDPAAPPTTPWSPQLQPAFDGTRLIVHEERLVDQLLRADLRR